MQKQAPSIFQITTIAAFVLSCFGILLFIWVTFGGPTPLAAKGFIVKVPFNQIGQLANQSDVRIAGVSVGKVTALELEDGRTGVTTVELEDKYGPIPEDTRAILRQKTLLGETYIELTPGEADGPMLPDGGTINPLQVAPSVQLDELLRAFDEPTRIAFQSWMADASVALKGRSGDLSAALGLLEPTLTDANKVLTTLDTQNNAVGQLVKNTGVVFNALTERQGQLRTLIENSNAVFTTTAQRNQDIEDLFVVLPTFLDESTLTLNRLDQFATNANPLITQLRPAVKALTPVLEDVRDLTPELRGFLVGLKTMINYADRAYPSLRAFLKSDLPPLLTRIQPFLKELDPLLETLKMYRFEVAALLGNGATVINAEGATAETDNKSVRFLRVGSILGPDSLSAYPKRLKMNRNNSYPKPGGFGDVKTGLKSFQTYQCSSGVNAIYRDWSELTPAEQTNFTNSVHTNNPPPPLGPPRSAQQVYENLQEFAFADERNSDDLPTPGCVSQGSYTPIGQPGQPSSKYLHVFKKP